MSLQRFGTRVADRYGAAIRKMVGGNLNDLTFQWGNSGTHADGSTITVDRAGWKGMDRRDRRGMLIHELTHVATRNQGLGTGAAAETPAEAVRFALTGKHGLNPDALPEARRYARQQGWLDMAGTDGNGPRNGNNNRPTNRNRDTTVNNASKGGVNTPPPVSPGSAVNYAAQVAQQRMALAAALSQLRAQAGLVRGQYKTDLGAIRAQRVADTVAAESDALDRGMVGSSVDAQNRAAAVTNAAAARVDAQTQRTQALMALRQQGITARTDYVNSVQQIQQAKAAEQSQLAIAELQANAFDAAQSNYQQLYRRILAQLRGNGRKRPPYGAPSGNTAVEEMVNGTLPYNDRKYEGTAGGGMYTPGPAYDNSLVR